MQPGRIVEPDDERPGFLRVPAPVATPGFGRPERAKHGGDREKSKADGDRLVHDVVQHFQRRKLRCDAPAAVQDGAHDQRRDAEVDSPVTTATFDRLAENHRLETQHHAEQPQGRQLVPAGLAGLLLDQVGESHHGGEGEGAVPDEVCWHVQLHPPALERRHQRLDLVGLAHDRVPEQESDGGTDHQHDKGAQRAGLVLIFEIQIERRGHPAEQDKHFIEIADRDVANVGPQQVAFIPAHHGADQCHADRRPCQPRSDQRHGGALAARDDPQPVEDRAHEKEHAHPQDRRLAGKEVLQPEDTFGAGQAAGIGNDRQQGEPGHDQHQHPQRAPEPAQPNRGGNRPQQDALLVPVHVGRIAREREQCARHDNSGEQPVEPAASREKRLLEIDRGRCGVQAFNPISLSFNKENSRSVSIVLRLLDKASVARVASPSGASQTQTRRSRTYSIANTPRINKAQPR